MLNPIEEFRQIHIHAVTIASPNMSLHLLGCSLSRAVWPESETRFRESRIEDRSQDLEDGLLNQSILDIGDVPG